MANCGEGLSMKMRITRAYLNEGQGGRRSAQWAVLGTLAWLMPAVLSGCAAVQHKASGSTGTVTPQMRSGSIELRAYQLLDWIAPDDRNLIVNAVDRSLYRAQFRHQCTG